MLRVWLILFIFVPVLAVNAKVPPENVVGAWLFDEGRGDVVSDISGNQHDGKITSAKWVDGKFGKALLFEGNGQVTVQSTEKLQLGDYLTMMAYFSTKALTDWHQIIAKDNEYLLRIDVPGEGSRMSAFVNLNSGWEPRASSPNVPDKDTWIHLAGVYNSKDRQLRLFVDGELAGQTGRDGKPNPGNAPVTFGTWGGSSRFRGIIDDVGIFNIALEEEDIKEIATVGLKVFLGGGISVQPSGKLTTTWGNIKRKA